MKLSKFLFTLSFIGLSLLATQESIPAGQMNQTIDTISLSDTSLTVGGSTTLNATATSGLPVSFTSTSPTICTISNNKIKGITVGDCLVIASQAGNVNYKPALQTLKVINVAKGNQAIGVIRLNPATLTIGGTTTISAVTTSKLPITFNSSTPSTCAVLGNTITAVTTGTCTIMAIQAGDANYNPAPVKSTNITIGKGNQTIGAISFNPPTLAVGGTTTASAMATSNLPVSFSTTTSSVCTTGGINGNTVTGVAGGSCTIAANQAGDSNWNPASQVTKNFTVDTIDVNSGTWTVTGSMNTARWGHIATRLANGKVLVAGGWNSGSSLTSAELYDPSTGIWSITGQMNTARGDSAAATLLTNGKVLVAGGSNASGLVKSAELYDPSTGTWSITGSMNTAVNEHATLLANGKVLVAGGYSGGGGSCCLKNVELYDPSTGIWSTTDPMSKGHYGYTATLLTNGKVLIAAGHDGSYNNFTTSELYDPSTGTWSTTGQMKASHWTHSATLLANGKVLVAGSYWWGNSEKFSATAELYDPISDTWSLTNPMTKRRGHHTATLLANGKVLVAGSEVNTDGSTTDSAELYDPGTGVWSATAAMSTKRAYQTAILLNNGKVLIMGGMNGNSSLASAELYNP